MDTLVNKHFNAKNINGQRFNQLTCLSYSHSLKGKPYCTFLCDCGRKVIKLKGNVVSGHTKSCGHLIAENTVKANSTKKGASSRPLWGTYRAMIRRCHVEKDSNYHRYGGRGIIVHSGWINDFYAFEKYVGNRPKGTTLDRIDNNGNYEPGNLRWATQEEQMNNTRANVKLSVGGITMSKKEAAIALKISEGAISWRLKNWGTHEKKK